MYCRILDDMEMYEKQQPFTIEDLISMSDMLNQLVFRLIWQDVLGKARSSVLCFIIIVIVSPLAPNHILIVILLCTE